MKVERLIPIPLTKEQAEQYAISAAQESTKKNVVKAKYLGGGSFGRAYDIAFSDKTHIVVKLLRAKDMLKKEVTDTTLLSEHCTIKMPEIIFSREADDSIPVDLYGMEKIGGKNAMMAFGMLVMSKKRRLEFADKVTEALHNIHECKNELFGDTTGPIYSEWLDYYKPFAKAVLEKAEEMCAQGQLSQKVVFAMRDAWEKFDIIFSEKVDDACLIHGDLNVANIMVGKNYEITGFIDPLNSMYADREYDLFQFNNLTGKRFHLSETYIKKYGSSKFCDQKLAFYGLYHEVYCYIKSGVLINMIMNPLVKNMNKKVAEL